MCRSCTQLVYDFCLIFACVRGNEFLNLRNIYVFMCLAVCRRCVREQVSRTRIYPSILSWELVAERAGVVKVFRPSDAPKLVWRRSKDPKPRRLFDSSEVLDDIEPLLQVGCLFESIGHTIFILRYAYVCVIVSLGHVIWRKTNNGLRIDKLIVFFFNNVQLNHVCPKPQIEPISSICWAARVC